MQSTMQRRQPTHLLSPAESRPGQRSRQLQQDSVESGLSQLQLRGSGDAGRAAQAAKTAGAAGAAAGGYAAAAGDEAVPQSRVSRRNGLCSQQSLQEPLVSFIRPGLHSAVCSRPCSMHNLMPLALGQRSKSECSVVLLSLSCQVCPCEFDTNIDEPVTGLAWCHVVRLTYHGGSESSTAH